VHFHRVSVLSGHGVSTARHKAARRHPGSSTADQQPGVDVRGASR
jgi:hypothetical protein